MKILYYNHTGKVSGAERLLLTILKSLDRQRFEPVVVCPDEATLAQLVRELNIRCETIPTLEARFTIRIDRLFGYLKSFFTVIGNLRNKIKALDPDVVHANSIRAGLVATVASFGLHNRVVWHLHDLLPRHPLSTAIRLFAFLFTRARMIAVSQAVADNFSGTLFPLRNRMRVILNAIDIEEFTGALENSRSNIRRELGIDDDATVVGIVGLITKRKRQLELIEAFADASGKLRNPALVIVGEPLFNRDREYAAKLEEAAIELGVVHRVYFTGARKDIPALMKSLDLLVVNSSAEPFGLVAVESMACGTPVLAAATGGLCEIIDDRRNGFLFERQENLACAIVDACQSRLRPEIISNATSIVATRFDSRRYASELQDFYCQIANATEPIGLERSLDSLQRRTSF